MIDKRPRLIDQYGKSAAVVIKSAQRLDNLLRRDIRTGHSDQLAGVIQDRRCNTNNHFARTRINVGIGHRQPVILGRGSIPASFLHVEVRRRLELILGNDLIHRIQADIHIEQVLVAVLNQVKRLN
ncbi:hypothetical protein D3C80_1644200 [compost metagenome]